MVCPNCENIVELEDTGDWLQATCAECKREIYGQYYGSNDLIPLYNSEQLTQKPPMRPTNIGEWGKS
jgi:hypothetical protein